MMNNKVAISYYDEVFYKDGYVLVNELYEDSEGFYKNHWQWGEQEGEFLVNPKVLDGLSSNSYADFSEALKVFSQKIEKNSK